MNVKNNKRRQNSREKIEKVFVELLQKKHISQITVADICKRSELNRSTFYANYRDIYDLADKLRDSLAQEVKSMYEINGSNKYQSYNWLKLFEHIKENQMFYKTYFKLGYDNDKIDVASLEDTYRIFPDKYMEYHMEFFRSGFNAIVKRWLDGGCRETPEEMNAILVSEYNGRI